jgi:hypothetical protein
MGHGLGSIIIEIRVVTSDLTKAQLLFTESVFIQTLRRGGCLLFPLVHGNETVSFAGSFKPAVGLAGFMPMPIKRKPQ